MENKTKILVILLLFGGCSSSYHAQQAKRHLDKLDPKDAEKILVDSTARKVVFKGKTDGFKFNEVPGVPTYLKGKEGIKTKYLREKDTVYLEVECPPDTVTVYDTKETTIYKVPATYKGLIKEIFNINEFQFWLLHVIVVLVGVMVVLMRIFSK